MKKLFILLMSFLLLAIPVFAGALQDDWETQIREKEFVKTSEALNSYNPDVIVMDDYNTYKSGGDSLYGRILQLKKDYRNATTENLDKKYVDILVKKYNDRVIGAQTHTFKAGIISVPDNEYSQLSYIVKRHIFYFNYLLAQDI